MGGVDRGVVDLKMIGVFPATSGGAVQGLDVTEVVLDSLLLCLEKAVAVLGSELGERAEAPVVVRPGVDST